MPSEGANIEIAEIDRVEIAVEPWSWQFAFARRDEIDRNFARRQSEGSAIWNGRVLLLHRYVVRDGVLQGACFETDYASFLAWRDWGFPDAGVFNVFGSAALQSADGAFLLGEMGPSTASAGSVYFPCGTPDPDDISAEGTLDLAGSVSRELLEETGLEIAALDVRPGWIMVQDRGFLNLMKLLTARQNAEEFRARIMHNLAAQARPEFCDIRIVRGPADLDHRVPRFLVAYFEKAWRR
jgi:8-oxo-dGTP pyrophosphatase MutT (NUDIX family)